MTILGGACMKNNYPNLMCFGNEPYKCVSRADNALEYHCTYKYLADAKKYVESIKD